MLAFNWFFLRRPTRSISVRARTGSSSSSTSSSRSSRASSRRGPPAGARSRAAGARAALLAEAATSLLGGGSSPTSSRDRGPRCRRPRSFAHAWITLDPRRRRSPEASPYPSSRASAALGTSRCRLRAVRHGPRGGSCRRSRRCSPSRSIAKPRTRRPRSGGVAAQRRDQDDAAAGGLARLRSPLTAIRRGRRARASGARARRGRPGGAGGDDRPRLRGSSAGRRPARPLAARSRRVKPVRELWSVDGLVGAALDGLRETAPRRSKSRRTAARRGRRRPDEPGARQPPRERAPACARHRRASGSLRRRRPGMRS